MGCYSVDHMPALFQTSVHPSILQLIPLKTKCDDVVFQLYFASQKPFKPKIFLSALPRREILRVLGLMKTDMVNFTIQSLRPHLLQQAVQYERAKFQQILDKQPGEDVCPVSEWWITKVTLTVGFMVSPHFSKRKRLILAALKHPYAI